MFRKNRSPAHFRTKGIDWWKMEETPFAAFVLSRLKEGRVLEIGCGRGAFTSKLRRNDLIALDVNRDFLVYCRAKPECAHASFLQADAHRLPFASGRFDAVVLLEVLMHLQDPIAALAEVGRVLRPGGVAFVTFLRKWRRNHLKTMALVLTGLYRRRYGVFDYRFDSERTIRRYADGAGMTVASIDEVVWSNPCAVMVKGG